MLLFVAYAVLVWYGAFSGRRRLGGFAAIGAGLFVLLTVNAVHLHVAQALGYEHLVPVFRVLLYPYIAMVVAVATFLVLLPIELPRGEIHCRVCRYDLSDLKEEVRAGSPCPECGTTLAEGLTRKGRRTAHRRRRAMSRLEPEPVTGISLGLAPHQPHDRAQDQHEHRQPADEEPAQSPQPSFAHRLDDRERGCVA